MRSICILLILGMLACFVLHARLELGNRVPDIAALIVLELVLHLAHERGVLFQQSAGLPN